MAIVVNMAYMDGGRQSVRLAMICWETLADGECACGAVRR